MNPDPYIKNEFKALEKLAEHSEHSEHCEFYEDTPRTPPRKRGRPSVDKNRRVQHRQLRMPRSSMGVIKDVIQRAKISVDPHRHSVLKRLYIDLSQTVALVCDAMPVSSHPKKGCCCLLCACTLNRLQYEAGMMGYVVMRPNPVETRDMEPTVSSDSHPPHHQ